MSRLSDARILGGIGSILEIIPFLSIVGYILTLIAVKHISDEVHDGQIFSDMLYAVVSGVVGAALGAGIILFGTFSAILAGGFAALFGALAFLVVIWVALVVSSIFIRKAFNRMAERLNIGTFRTAGTLYFIGALLTIILVGVIIMFVAYVVQIVAFFSINEAAVKAQAPVSGAPIAPSSGKLGEEARYCPTCGSPIPVSATFCPKCGAKQP